MRLIFSMPFYLASLPLVLGGLFVVPFFANADSPALCPFTWSTNLKMGANSADVMKLQEFLNTNSDTAVAIAGDGSAGMETKRFGALTAKAVAKFQEKYAVDILTPNGLTKGTGMVGASTRAKLNTLCTGNSVPSLPSSSTPSAPLTVAPAPVQPKETLAPANALYVPFTNIILSAGASDVTVKSITVERVGPSSDGAFFDVELMADDGTVLSTAYINAKHQAVFRDSFTVSANSVMTLTIAGDMAIDLSANQGEMAGLKVIAVNTSAPVSGFLPIVGTYQKMNSTLTIGAVTATLSPDDPQADRTRYITDTSVTFSGIRVTAGSAEDVRLNSVTWEQSGTAGAGDIVNITTAVKTVSYPTTNDGRYYTSVFPDGIVIAKGNSLDIAIKGDLGTTGSNRTVKFDIEHGSDVDVTGLTYGFGISLVAEDHTGTSGNSVFITQDGSPDTEAGSVFFSGSAVSISPGAINSIGK